jgi:hypothetical protein
MRKTRNRPSMIDCLVRLPCDTTTRMKRKTLALWAVLAVAMSSLGCEEETTTDTESVEVDPPTMELVSPAEGACVSIGTDPNARVSFVLKSTWLYLRPPGICGTGVQCGQLALWVDDTLVTRAATNVIEWEVATVPNRYGEFKFRIEALTDAGKAITDADDKPLVATRTITTAVACP